MQTDLQLLQSIAGRYKTGLKVEDLITIVYRQLKIQNPGIKVVKLNDRYLIVNGKNYQFVKDNIRETWKVKEY